MKTNPPAQDPNAIDLCKSCYCMTHTVNGNCGKCGEPRAAQDPDAIKQPRWPSGAHCISTTVARDISEHTGITNAAQASLCGNCGKIVIPHMTTMAMDRQSVCKCNGLAQDAQNTPNNRAPEPDIHNNRVLEQDPNGFILQPDGTVTSALPEQDPKASEPGLNDELRKIIEDWEFSVTNVPKHWEKTPERQAQDANLISALNALYLKRVLSVKPANDDHSHMTRNYCTDCGRRDGRNKALREWRAAITKLLGGK